MLFLVIYRINFSFVDLSRYCCFVVFTITSDMYAESFRVVEPAYMVTLSEYFKVM
jgi:hypothetical protein